jgi:hypothetical protein
MEPKIVDMLSEMIDGDQIKYSEARNICPKTPWLTQQSVTFGYCAYPWFPYPRGVDPQHYVARGDAGNISER